MHVAVDVHKCHARIELHARISICTKTNHGTGVAVNSGKLLHDLMKMGSDVAARYSCRYMHCLLTICSRVIINFPSRYEIVMLHPSSFITRMISISIDFLRPI